MISRIEALLDALISLTAYTEPDSKQYRFRNPLGLKVFCEHHYAVNNCPTCKGHLSHAKREYDGGITIERKYDPDTGLRIYSNYIQGYQSAIFDLLVKCTGKSHSKIRDTSTVKDLVRSYYLPDGSDLFVARFLRRALQDESITEETAINYFAVGKEVANGERRRQPVES